jgi:hypothetical protein
MRAFLYKIIAVATTCASVSWLPLSAVAYNSYDENIRVDVDSSVGIEDVEDTKITQRLVDDYICTTGVELSNNIAANATWQAYLKCAVGVPIGIRVYVYYANVNFPKNYTLIGTNSFSCRNVVGECRTPEYSRPISRTQKFHVVAEGTVIGVSGITDVMAVKPSLVNTFNDRGKIYPNVISTRPGMTPIGFPSEPYGRIADRGSTFRNDLKKLYEQQNWPFPASPYSGHHVKPLEWGGTDDLSNGVLLDDYTHYTIFHRGFWDHFSNRSWLS